MTHHNGDTGTARGGRDADLDAVRLEVDELRKLGIITDAQASTLNERLTEDVVREHLGTAMSITELIDMYIMIISAEGA